MAKKKKASDRHKSNRMIRVSPEKYEALRRVASKNRRPVTWELDYVLEKYLREMGELPPPKT